MFRSRDSSVISSGIAIEHDNSRNTHSGSENGMDSAVLFNGDYDACNSTVSHVGIIANTGYNYSETNNMPYQDFETLDSMGQIQSFLYWNPETKTLIYEFAGKQLSYSFNPAEVFGGTEAYIAYTGAANYGRDSWTGDNSVRFIYFDYIDYSAKTD